MRQPRVILVTEPGQELRLGALAARGTVDASFAVHLRFARGLEDAARLCGALGAPLVASADPPVMRALSLDGIHLGGARRATLRSARAALGPDAWISVPAHTDDEVREAAAGGATAAYVSPIFETPGKGPARGLAQVRRARALAGTMLVYALGGVTADNAEACVVAGADGVAVIRAFFGADDGAAALSALDAAVRRGLASRSAS